MTISTESLATGFRAQFGKNPERMYFSPGRVNLIGEHIDYNGGSVLPAAIDRGTYYAVGTNADDCINVYAEALDSRTSIPVAAISEQVVDKGWTDYLKGALVEFENRSLVGSQGLDIYITGDLPRNSGLSSSASFTVGLLFLMDDMWNTDLEKNDFVLYAKSVENNFIGLQCGVMDQFAVTHGKAGHAIRLQCDTLESESVPIALDGYEIVITDSQVPRKLSESAYNQRRSECEEALTALRNCVDVEFLCEASIADLENCDAVDKDAIPYRRARHAISENERVAQSVRALNNGDLAQFGELMYASHKSLRDDYEVSCKELDLLVDMARDIPGVVGSRMTGAGFGGCTVSIVESDAVDRFISDVTASYAAATDYQASMVRCLASDGVKRLGR